jgi:ferredoxin
MSRPKWFVELVKIPFPYRRFLAQFTNLPIIGSITDRMLFCGDDILYLPDDRVIQIHESVDAATEMALPSQVVEHFVEQASYHVIMHACLCRQADGCQDYPVDLGCLFMGEAARGINSKLGRSVTKQEALAHLRRCRDAGLVHMVGRNKLDTMWLGVGPGDKLLTVCNCCPCCCLWRMVPHVSPEIGDKVQRMPGLDVTVTDRCQACGLCTQGVCFVDAIHLSNSHAVINHHCKGCGRCVAVCPEGAIELTIDDSQFVQNAIARLAPLVDVS